jgi:hypothetical protein
VHNPTSLENDFLKKSFVKLGAAEQVPQPKL